MKTRALRKMTLRQLLKERKRLKREYWAEMNEARTGKCTLHPAERARHLDRMEIINTEISKRN